MLHLVQMNDQEGNQGSNSLPMALPSLIAAAHELKSPLVVMRQFGFMLSRPDVTEAERRVLLQRLILTADRGLRLTNDLTKMARLEDALFQLEPESGGLV